MRKTHSCPKCDCTDIFKRKEIHLTGNNVIMLNNWGTKYVFVHKYICTRCGFVESTAEFTPKESKWLDAVIPK